MSTQKRAYKFRFYPTSKQRKNLAQTFGCCRVVYNWGLATRTSAYRDHQQSLFFNDTCLLLTELKQQDDRLWLNDVSSVPLQQSLRHLDTAFKRFFQGQGEYPKFKKKQHAQSATYTVSAFKYENQQLTLAKMKEPLKIVWSRPLPKESKPSTVTVSQDSAGRYFVSILIEEEIEPLPVTTKTIGLDLGLKSMVITSDGETYGNPRFFVKDEKKLARAQRRCAKKRKGSKNKEKARRKVARIHARIADRRRDYQHKLSTHIVHENQVICVETLKVKNMVQNHTLAKAISDVGWSEFVRQLEYKAGWYGRTVVKIDTWFPSSKTCSVCHHVLESLSLDVREWTCPDCATVHDRDINAAHNVLAEGLSVYACGEMCKPKPEWKPGKAVSRRSRKADK